MTLAQRLQQPTALLAPGIYDALTALVAEQAGFEALYLSGASIAYTRLGRSDVGLTTATEVADSLARITERVRLPVIVDADTGFGNALNTQRTMRAFERAGAAMGRCAPAAICIIICQRYFPGGSLPISVSICVAVFGHLISITHWPHWL
jgi:2-methylisocitrate lyase-like PEP mutase family enzyme